MDRRTETRFAAGQPISLTVLSEGDRRVDALIIELAGCTAQIAVPGSIASGTAVRLDLDDTLMLGEILGCTAAESGFALRIRLEQVIPSVADLSKLVLAIAGAGTGALRRAAQASVR